MRSSSFWVILTARSRNATPTYLLLRIQDAANSASDHLDKTPDTHLCLPGLDRHQRADADQRCLQCRYIWLAFLLIVTMFDLDQSERLMLRVRFRLGCV